MPRESKKFQRTRSQRTRSQRARSRRLQLERLEDRRLLTCSPSALPVEFGAAAAQHKVTFAGTTLLQAPASTADLTVGLIRGGSSIVIHDYRIDATNGTSTTSKSGTTGDNVGAVGLQVPVNPGTNNVAFSFVRIDTVDGKKVENAQPIGSVTVCVNRAPVAVNDSFTINEDVNNGAGILLSVLTKGVNDSDADGDTISVTGVGNPKGGTATREGNQVRFTPRMDGNRDNTPAFGFTYNISDGNGGTDTGSVNIIVTPVNDPPTLTAANRGISVPEDSPRKDVGLAPFFSDIDSNLTFSLESVTARPGTDADLVNAEVSNSNLGLTFKTDSFGTVDVVVRASDGIESVLGTFPVSVNSVLDPPVIESLLDGEDQVVGALSSPVLTNDNTPTLTGTAESGSQVRLLLNGAGGIQLGNTVQVGADQAWTIPIPSALPEGASTLVAEAKLGSETRFSFDLTDDFGVNDTPFEVDVDTMLRQPIVTGIDLDAGFANDDFLTNDSSPKFLGTSDENDAHGPLQLTLTVDGTTTTPVDQNSDGSWAIDLPAGAAATTGTYPFTVQARDTAGNTASVGRSLFLDVTPPAISNLQLAPVDSPFFILDIPTLSIPVTNVPNPILEFELGEQTFDGVDNPVTIDLFDIAVTLAAPAVAGDGQLVTTDPIQAGSLVTLAPGETSEEQRAVTNVDVVGNSFRLTLDSPLAFDHLVDTPVGREIQAEDTVLGSGSDGTASIKLSREAAVGPGQHTVRVRATDGAGNVSTSDQSFFVTDAGGPTLAAPGTPVNSTIFTLPDALTTGTASSAIKPWQTGFDTTTQTTWFTTENGNQLAQFDPGAGTLRLYDVSFGDAIRPHGVFFDFAGQITPRVWFTHRLTGTKEIARLSYFDVAENRLVTFDLASVFQTTVTRESNDPRVLFVSSRAGGSLASNTAVIINRDGNDEAEAIVDSVEEVPNSNEFKVTLTEALDSTIAADSVVDVAMGLHAVHVDPTGSVWVSAEDGNAILEMNFEPGTKIDQQTPRITVHAKATHATATGHHHESTGAGTGGGTGTGSGNGSGEPGDHEDHDHHEEETVSDLGLTAPHGLDVVVDEKTGDAYVWIIEQDSGRVLLLQPGDAGLDEPDRWTEWSLDEALAQEAFFFGTLASPLTAGTTEFSADAISSSTTLSEAQLVNSILVFNAGQANEEHRVVIGFEETDTDTIVTLDSELSADHAPGEILSRRVPHGLFVNIDDRETPGQPKDDLIVINDVGFQQVGALHGSVRVLDPSEYFRDPHSVTHSPVQTWNVPKAAGGPTGQTFAGLNQTYDDRLGTVYFIDRNGGVGRLDREAADSFESPEISAPLTTFTSHGVRTELPASIVSLSTAGNTHLSLPAATGASTITVASTDQLEVDAQIEIVSGVEGLAGGQKQAREVHTVTAITASNGAFVLALDSALKHDYAVGAGVTRIFALERSAVPAGLMSSDLSSSTGLDQYLVGTPPDDGRAASRSGPFRGFLSAYGILYGSISSHDTVSRTVFAETARRQVAVVSSPYDRPDVGGDDFRFAVRGRAGFQVLPNGDVVMTARGDGQIGDTQVNLSSLLEATLGKDRDELRVYGDLTAVVSNPMQPIVHVFGRRADGHLLVLKYMTPAGVVSDVATPWNEENLLNPGNWEASEIASPTTSVLSADPRAFVDSAGRTGAIVPSHDGHLWYFPVDGAPTDLSKDQGLEARVYSSVAIVEENSAVFIYGTDQQGRVVEYQYDVGDPTMAITAALVNFANQPGRVVQDLSAVVHNGQRHIFGANGGGSLTHVAIEGNAQNPDNVVVENVSRAASTFGYFSFQESFAGRIVSGLTAGVTKDNRLVVYGTNGKDLIQFQQETNGDWQAANLTNDTVATFGEGRGGVDQPSWDRIPANTVFGAPAMYVDQFGEQHVLQINKEGEVVEYYTMHGEAISRIHTRNVSLVAGNTVAILSNQQFDATGAPTAPANDDVGNGTGSGGGHGNGGGTGTGNGGTGNGGGTGSGGGSGEPGQLALGGTSEWQNPTNPTDVLGSGRTELLGAIAIMNELLARGSHELEARTTGSTTRYFDVTGDGWVRLNDVLAVVNKLIEIRRGHGESQDGEQELGVLVGDSLGEPFDGLLADEEEYSIGVDQVMTIDWATFWTDEETRRSRR